MLFGIIFLLINSKTVDFKLLNFELLDFNSQLVLFACFFLGFSVKVPIFPFYSWLPEAHVEASTAVSVLLAAIFLKIATYGFLKILVFNFFFACQFFYSFIFYFSIISILLGTLLSFLQTDLKKIIALSSVIHMNYIVIGIFSLDVKAIFGSIIYMMAHGIVSTGLFFLIGIIYESTGTRDLLNLNSLKHYNSKLIIFFFLFNLANLSFPFSISFISELIILNNLTGFNIFILFILIFCLFFAIIYTFWFLHNIFFGKILSKKNFFFLNKFDMFVLSILLILIFF